MMEKLKASVQYGDWEGTVAADNADHASLSSLLADRGLLDRDNEFLIAADLWIGENHGGQVEAPTIRALILDATGHANVDQFIQNHGGPLPLKKVDLELSLHEFIGLFKRFNIVLTQGYMNLNGLEYEVQD